MSVSHADPSCSSAESMSWLDCGCLASLSLVELLERVPDPRFLRGIRFRFSYLLAVAVVCALAGATNFRELGDHADDLPQQVLWELGGRPCLLRRRVIAPSESTLRRTVRDVGAGLLDRVIGSWLLSRSRHLAQAAGATTGTGEADTGADTGAAQLWGLAFDGKVQRGSWTEDGECRLFSAMLHGEGVVVAQVKVPAGTTETTQVKALLDEVDITGALVTADAAHTNADTAEYLVTGKNAHYLLPVKGNTPTLQAAVWQLLLPCLEGAPDEHVTERGHGRINTWKIWCAPSTGIAFPHTGQVAAIRRDVHDTDGTARSKEIVLFVTDLTAGQITAAQLNTHARHHWGIEVVHWVRDTLWREDDHQAYTGNSAQSWATLHNLALGLIRQAGIRKIKSTVQAIGRQRNRALPLIAGIT